MIWMAMPYRRRRAPVAGVRARWGRSGAALAIALALGAGGCAKARAEAVPDGPPLRMPDPPARVLAPLAPPGVSSEPAEPEATPVAAEPAAEVPQSVPAPRPRPAPAPPPPAPSAPPAPTARDLRATAPGNVLSERGVRDLLARARSDLSEVNERALSAAGRLQYDQAARFTAQAAQALEDRNLIFAQTLAEKALALAAELLAR